MDYTATLRIIQGWFSGQMVSSVDYTATWGIIQGWISGMHIIRIRVMSIHTLTLYRGLSRKCTY